MGDVPRILNMYVQISFVITIKKKFCSGYRFDEKQKNYSVQFLRGINFRSSLFGFDLCIPR